MYTHIKNPKQSGVVFSLIRLLYNHNGVKLGDVLSSFLFSTYLDTLLCDVVLWLWLLCLQKVYVCHGIC